MNAPSRVQLVHNLPDAGCAQASWPTPALRPLTRLRGVAHSPHVPAPPPPPPRPWAQERAYITGLTAANLVIDRLGEGRPADILDVVSACVFVQVCVCVCVCMCKCVCVRVCVHACLWVWVGGWVGECGRAWVCRVGCR